MFDRFRTIALLFAIIPILCFSQSVVFENTHQPMIDEPLTQNRDLAKSRFRIMNVFRCPDSVYVKEKCRCTQRGRFDDSGSITQVIIGKDIANGRESMTVNFEKIKGGLYKSRVLFSPSYVRANLLQFTFDTVINGQQQKVPLYPSEHDSSVQVISELSFTGDREEADKILRYDRDGKLRVAVYPMGNRKELRRFTDTLIENEQLTIKENVYYPENSFHSFHKYNVQKRLLENGYFNFTYGTQPEERKTQFIYDNDGKLIFAHTTSNNNSFLHTESYRYHRGVLAEYLKLNRPFDSLDYEKKVFYDDGSIKSQYKISSLYERNEEVSFYHYRNGLKIRRDDYFNGKHTGSTFYFYE